MTIMIITTIMTITIIMMIMMTAYLIAPALPSDWIAPMRVLGGAGTLVSTPNPKSEEKGELLRKYYNIEMKDVRNMRQSLKE